MTCCVCSTGVRGLEQMVDNRMNHATTHATTHAKKNASSNVQSNGILNVTRIAFLSLSPNAHGEPRAMAAATQERRLLHVGSTARLCENSLCSFTIADMMVPSYEGGLLWVTLKGCHATSV